MDKADFFGTSLSPETGGSDIKTVQRIAKNTIALSLMNVFRLVASVIFTILVARIWRVESLGRYAFVFAFVAPFSFLTDLGVNLLIIGEGQGIGSGYPSM